MDHLTRKDYAQALTLLASLEPASTGLFSARDCARLEMLRPHLAFLCLAACRGDSPPLAPVAREPVPAELTPREREVLQWLATGKTDADIAALLAISPRTVQKHLEHLYIKLGVETRTAAVMRGLGMRRGQGANL